VAAAATKPKSGCQLKRPKSAKKLGYQGAKRVKKCQKQQKSRHEQSCAAAAACKRKRSNFFRRS